VRRLAVALLISVLAGALAAAETARSLARKARQAEAAGELAAASGYYAQAAALDPSNRRYWLRSVALRRQALAAERSLPAALARAGHPGREAASDEFLGRITPGDLEEARRLAPPPELEGSPEKRSFELKGNARQLWERSAQAYGLTAVFDPEYPPGPSVSLRIESAGFRDALRIVAAATGSFLVPLGPRLFFVAKDTPQKRQEFEPAMAIVIPIPEPVSVQETQELARAIQQAMEIPRLVIDSQKRLVLIRDRVSRVRPAQLLFEQMMRRRPEVVVDVEFVEIAENSSLSYGLRLPGSFPLAMLGKFLNVTGEIPKNVAYATFGGGATLIGLGLADAELLASMTHSSSALLLRAELRSVHGQPATLHVGDKFPIMTVGYFGRVEGEGRVYTPPPSFNFEDLGMVVKVTPYVHGTSEVTLEVETEFKVLAGEALNGIPVISNRKFQGTTRLRNGEWAVIAGLVRSEEVRALAGLAGLSQVPLLGPLLRQNTRERQSSQILIVLKPRLVSLPPTETVTIPVWTGTEARPLLPM
jgi:general secretion pathway protein D